jgi:hypothetical protein
MTKSTGRDPRPQALHRKSMRAYKRTMSRAAFVVLVLLTIPHDAEARASGRETATRTLLLCETHTRSFDARDCIEQPRLHKEFDAAPIVTSTPFSRER